MNVEIDINNYLSEEDKKNLAIDVFKSRVREELFKSIKGTIQSDSEVQRVIGNITHHVVFEEVQKHIPDAKERIKKGVEKALSKDMSYYVFKKKDAWDKEESLAVKYLREEVQANESVFKNRIKKAVFNYDPSSDIKEQMSSKFESLAENMQSLSDLFQGK